MKILKDECDKEFAEKKLELTDEKCNSCQYLYLCPYMAMAMDDVVNGDDGY
jgi:radical SAM protein with 4Fe4S-binding SPASM domain